MAGPIRAEIGVCWNRWRHEKEIEDCFGTELTSVPEDARYYRAGLNRINRYIVAGQRRLADYITVGMGPQRGKWRSFDTRRLSREFSIDAALTLAANGITA